ncbi:PEP/pyruvate-binding domain-containing protein [Micromonospora sp. NPDC049662]|uniref:PEP/pyruvate-binding domain-containing protein n=1 Tax=Micromonospora sp. NPDC049662 TaxID=3155397 RepID=UPI00342E45ED
MTPHLWVDLSRALDPAVVGGKGAQLGRMIRLGVAVPGGGVVTAAAHRSLRDGRLQQSAFDNWLIDHLQAAGHDATTRFAVRSSAAVEDSRRASFAGQFLSVLDVERDDVPAAVAHVQASVDNPSAHAYGRRVGAPVPSELAVVVQEQLRPRLAGVCFSADPVTGAAEAVLEYAEGLADALLSGRVLPAATLRIQYDGKRPRRTEPAVPHHHLLMDVVRLALRLAERLGDPQDVEWAVDERGLWALQTRPITTLAGPLASGDQLGGTS